LTTLLAPVAGGHHTTVAELSPLIARASTGAPTVELLAADVVALGQVASDPLDLVCATRDAVLLVLAAGAVVAACAATAPSGTAIPIVIASALKTRASREPSTLTTQTHTATKHVYLSYVRKR
jgi:hypothetical protein